MRRVRAGGKLALANEGRSCPTASRWSTASRPSTEEVSEEQVSPVLGTCGSSRPPEGMDETCVKFRGRSLCGAYAD
jgi:hypothetical protein